MLKAFGPNIYHDFMLKHASEYPIGPDTFKGARGEVHGCFMNAFHLAHENDALTYVEGKVSCHGVPLDHAWCIDSDGVVIDPTLEDKGQVLGYYGIPFSTEYVQRVILAHKVYCSVLDFFSAPLTAPKLYELGPQAGQQWLIDQPRRSLALREKKRRA
jgi:hypothetical protein